MQNSLPPLPSGFKLDDHVASAPALPAGFTLDAAQPAQASIGERARTIPAALNAGIADVAGLPAKTALDVWDLGKAGVGYVQSKITGHTPSAIFDPSDRAQYTGTPEWIERKLNNLSIQTQPERPDDTVSKYLYAGTRAIPAALAGGSSAGGANIARQIAAGATSGVAAQGAADLGAGPAVQAVTALAAGAGAAAAKIPARTTSVPKALPPTTAELKTKGQDAYARADSAGLELKPQSVSDLKTSITQAVDAAGSADPTLHPSTTAALRRIDQLQPQTLSDLDRMRQMAKDAAQSTAPADRRLAKIIVNQIDNYGNNLKLADITAGDLKTAIPALRDARDYWSRYRKSEVIDELIRKAELSAPNYSASGMENAVRIQFRQLAKNPRRMQTFTPEERTAIETVAKGGSVENTLRYFGKFAPTGIVSSAALGALGHTTTSGGALAVGTLAWMSREAAKRMTLRNAQLASELVRQGPQRSVNTANSAAPALLNAQQAAKAAPATVAELEAEAQRNRYFENDTPSPKQRAAESDWLRRYNAAKDLHKAG